MSGHSKYSNIKHKKNLNDQKKAKTFHTYLKQIESILKETNNSNLESNFKLKQAFNRAIQANVPKKNLINLINNFAKQNFSTDDNAIFLFKGSNGKFIIVSGFFDNKNRILYELKSTFLKINFSLITENWTNIFEQINLIKIEKSKINFELLIEILENAKIDDFFDKDHFYLIKSPMKNFQIIQILEEKNINFEITKNIFCPKFTLKEKLTDSEIEQFLTIKEKILGFNGVRTFSSNFLNLD